MVTGQAVVEQAVVIEGLEPQLVGDDEAIREMAEDRFLRAHGT